MSLHPLFQSLFSVVLGEVAAPPSSSDPYPEYDALGGFWIVVEPVDKYQERVWWASSSAAYYVRYTAALLDLEASRALAARPPATPFTPGPIGSRFD